MITVYYRRIVVKSWSERLDLNQRPHAPQACALPGCATLRFLIYEMFFLSKCQALSESSSDVFLCFSAWDFSQPHSFRYRRQSKFLHRCVTPYGLLTIYFRSARCCRLRQNTFLNRDANNLRANLWCRF